MISELFFLPILIFLEFKTGSLGELTLCFYVDSFTHNQYESVNLPGNIKPVKQLEAPQVNFSQLY